MPVGDFLQWHPHDRDAALSHRAHRGESCADCGVHPSVWKESQGGRRNAVVAKWVFCRPCELLDMAKAAGPPTDTPEAPGWRLVLRHTHTPQEVPAHG